jgi:hypothetical protein
VGGDWDNSSYLDQNKHGRQFLMGYQTLGGGLEMRPDRVAKHYLSTWFPFDALLIMEDWIDYLVVGMYRGSSILTPATRPLPQSWAARVLD